MLHIIGVLSVLFNQINCLAIKKIRSQKLGWNEEQYLLIWKPEVF